MNAEDAINQYVTLTDDLALFLAGPLSQWWQSHFEVEGVHYNCCEQFMMHRKAMLFGDFDIAARILSIGPTSYSDIHQREFNQFPSEQKKLGREVYGFNQDIWNEVCRPIVFRGNAARFQQDKLFRNTLILTEKRLCVEASPNDRIWGIGLKRSDPDALIKEKWLGSNFLGQTLTEVRDTFSH